MLSFVNNIKAFSHLRVNVKKKTAIGSIKTQSHPNQTQTEYLKTNLW